MLKACVDTNIWISGIVFSGQPAEIVTAALSRKFQVILSEVILEELERNLLGKFQFGRASVRRLLNRILQVADLYEPFGTVKVVPGNHADNFVLETALLGKAKYLVTGDREHLLPLKSFKQVKIVDASEFMKLLRRDLG
jgi:putative PIN family toxin of toxin-antitoxin system